LERLKDALLHFADHLDPAQPEEHAKNLLADLLKGTFYGAGYEVNIQGKIDLTIAKNGKAQVLVETKRPGKSTEMMTTANPNAKALQQALCKAHADFRGKDLLLTQTSDFYTQIAKPWFETAAGTLPCTVIDVTETVRSLRKQPDDLTPLVPLFKFLHPAHLLREAFGNDSNSLDKNFYGELLYWMC